jgi:hypothetical protein
MSPETPVVILDRNELAWDSVVGNVTYLVYRDGQMVAETSNTGYRLEENQSGGEYQVLAKTSDGIESFLSEPVTGSEENRLIMETEDYNLPSKDRIPGFRGNGYVEFSKKNNARLKFSVSRPEAGEWFLSFRYANGSGPVNTDNKCGIRTLFVNNQYASSLVFPQRGVNEWSNWGVTNTIKVNLKKGRNQLEIRFEPLNENMNGEINRFLLDQIVLERL